MDIVARAVVKDYDRGQKIIDGKTRARKERERLAKEALSKSKTQEKKVPTEKTLTQRVWEFARAYEKLWGIYSHKPTLKYFVEPPSEDSITYERFVKAISLAEQAGASYHEYIKCSITRIIT